MKSLLLATLFCLTFCLPALFASDVEFYEGRLEELQQKAGKYGKMSLVYFYASWCMPCQWMEKNTYRNAELADYLNKYYFPIRINIDAPEGSKEKRKYEVNLLPTILLFDGNGKLVARYEESMDPEKLLHLLKKNNLFPGQSDEELSVAQSPVLQAPKPKNIYYPPLVPEQNATQTHIPNTPQTAIQQTENGYSETAFPVYETPPSFYFGVQVGAFSSRSNAENELNILRQKLEEPLHIVAEQLQNRTIFKIIAGRFDHQEAAIQCMKSVKNRKIFGFVKKIDR